MDHLIGTIGDKFFGHAIQFTSKKIVRVHNPSGRQDRGPLPRSSKETPAICPSAVRQRPRCLVIIFVHAYGGFLTDQDGIKGTSLHTGSAEGAFIGIYFCQFGFDGNGFIGTGPDTGTESNTFLSNYFDHICLLNLPKST
jgi:hypothetical protein